MVYGLGFRGLGFRVSGSCRGLDDEDRVLEPILCHN